MASSRINPPQYATILDALKYILSLERVDNYTDSEVISSHEGLQDSITKKLLEDKDASALNEAELSFSLGAVSAFRKFLQQNLSRSKAGTATYNKARRSLDRLPRLISALSADLEAKRA